MLVSVPPGQYEPCGQGGVVVGVVPSHTDRAGQTSQMERPALEPYLPGGQVSGKDVPPGQYEPWGHVFPVTPSVGLSLTAAATQKKPAAQSPVVEDWPDVSQYRPGGHSRQSANEDARVTGWYRPTGHAAGVVVPATQKEPAGHSSPYTGSEPS